MLRSLVFSLLLLRGHQALSITNCTSLPLEECLTSHLVLLLDKAVHTKQLRLIPGTYLVRDEGLPRTEHPLTPDTLEDMVARSAGSKVSGLYHIAAQKLVTLLANRTFSSRMPSADSMRGFHLKLKKMVFPFVIGVLLKLAAFLPLVLFFMSGLALKAFLSSKTALLITGLIGLKNLFSSSSTPSVEKYHAAPPLYDLGDPYFGHQGLYGGHVDPGFQHGYPQGYQPHAYGRGFGDTPPETFNTTSSDN